MAYKLMQCESCGKSNRVSAQKLAEGLRPKCGACGRPLGMKMNPVAVTDRTFSEIVEKSAVPVLVDFWAPWCGPCLSIAPVIEQIAFDVGNTARVAKLNTDENPAVSNRFQIRSIPTLIIFKDGKEVDRMIGAQPRGQILSRLQRFLN